MLNFQSYITMKHLLLFVFFAASSLISLAQDPCASGRYASDVFTNVTVTSNITYGSNFSFANANTSLKLDFYEPTGDTASTRPLILWVHGGSFLGGSKTDGDMVALSNAFAKKGYVCASIDYRTGFFPIDSANAVKAVVRAVQDLRASVRYFYKDRADGINTYRIDTNNIYVGGSSAGAITSLHLAYLDRSCEINGYVPPANYASLGGIEGNSGNPCYSSKVNGVINLCGALAQYGWLEAGDLPLCSMHGTTDGTVKYNRGIVNPGVPLMYLDGSRMLHEQAQAVGVPSNFYTFRGAGHVPYLGGTATAMAYMDTTVRFVRDYLLERLGCTANPLQLPNAPSETANLYPFTICTGDSIIDFCDGSGLITVEGTSSISVYPNPSSTNVTVEWPSGQTYCIRLTDVMGRTQFIHEGESGKFAWSVNNLSKGTYVLTFSGSNGKLIRKKLVIE
jgi:poly(3-hydroxybutyrate) depolymerase